MSVPEEGVRAFLRCQKKAVKNEMEEEMIPMLAVGEMRTQSWMNLADNAPTSVGLRVTRTKNQLLQSCLTP